MSPSHEERTSGRDWTSGAACQVPQLILASRSPRRRELLALLDLPFHAIAAGVDERPSAGEVPSQTVARLARRKAQAAVARHPHALVLACDTIVVLGQELLGKPADADEARAMLSRLRGRVHQVHSAVALMRGEVEVVEMAETLVRMRAYTNEELDAYVASGDPMDKAGSYAIQHGGFRPAASWQGCYANVMGLPLCHLARGLATWRTRVPADVPAACQSYTGRRCSVFPSVLPPQTRATDSG